MSFPGLGRRCFWGVGAFFSEGGSPGGGGGGTLVLLTLLTAREREIKSSVSPSASSTTVGAAFGTAHELKPCTERRLLHL